MDVIRLTPCASAAGVAKPPRTFKQDITRRLRRSRPASSKRWLGNVLGDAEAAPDDMATDRVAVPMRAPFASCGPQGEYSGSTGTDSMGRTLL